MRLETARATWPTCDFAVNLDDRLPAEARLRAINHLDAPQIAALASEIDRKLSASADRLVDTNFFRVPVYVDDLERDQMQIIALNREMKLLKRAVAEPVFRLANVNNIAVDQEADAFLTQQYQIGPLGLRG